MCFGSRHAVPGLIDRGEPLSYADFAATGYAMDRLRHLDDDHGSVLTCHIGPRAGGDFWELNPIHPLGELN